jgi:hypothetical protein
LWDTWISRGGGRKARGTTQHPGTRARTSAPDPYFFSTLGFGLATPASWLSFFMLWSGAPLPVVAAPLVPSTIFVVLGVCQLQRERSSCAKPGPGAEKQLLMAIRDDTGLGGRHHPRRGHTREAADGGGGGGDPLPPRRSRTPRRREPGRRSLLRVARQTVGLDTGPTVPASPRPQGG